MKKLLALFFLFSLVQNAFLQEIALPDCITKIEQFAFENQGLSEINLPDTVVIIMEGAFACNELKELRFPDDIRVIGERAFERNKLEKLMFPNSIEFIDDSSFYYNQINSLDLPVNLKSIGSRAFERNRLISVIFPEDLNYIGEKAFADNKLKKITIPNKVEFIGNYAFYRNELIEISIGKDVYIGAGAMGKYGDQFIATYKDNKRKAGIYTYNKSSEKWNYTKNKSESLLSQLILWKYSGPLAWMVGILIAFVLCYVSIIKTSQKSRPVYSCSDEYVYAMKGKDGSPLKIFWNENLVENVRSIKLAFWNKGEKSIQQSDFLDDEPITIKCNDDEVKILDCSIRDISRSTLPIHLKLIDNQIQIHLSKKDEFDKNDGFQTVITYTSQYSAEDDWVVQGRMLNAHKVTNMRYKGLLDSWRIWEILARFERFSKVIFLGICGGIGAGISVGVFVTTFSILRPYNLPNWIHYAIAYTLLLLIWIYLNPIVFGKKHKTPKWSLSE